MEEMKRKDMAMNTHVVATRQLRTIVYNDFNLELLVAYADAGGQ